VSPVTLASRVRGLGWLVPLWIALTLLALMPIWSARLIPMLDTPNHLALIRAWHSFDDPRYRIAENFTLHIQLAPYLAYYWINHMLMYVVSIETANRLVLSLYVIGFPLCMLALVRSLRRDAALALFAFPLMFNQNWMYGFTAYNLAVASLLLCVAVALRYLDEGKVWQVVLVGVLGALTFLFHIMPYVYLGLLGLGLIYSDWRRWKRLLLLASSLVPSLVMAVQSVRSSQDDGVYFRAKGTFAATWRDFPTSVMEFPRRVMELFPGSWDAVALGLLAGAAMALYLWRETAPAPQSELTQRRVKAFLWLLGIAYLSIPYEISKPFSWWFVSPRVPPIMMLLIPLWPSRPMTGRWRWLMAPVVIAALILPVRLTQLYRSFSVRNAGFMRLVSEVPLGAPCLVLLNNLIIHSPKFEEKSGDPSSSAPVYWHFLSWPMALRGGYSAYVFDQGIPVRPKNKLPSPNWVDTSGFHIRQAPDYEYYLGYNSAQLDREPGLEVVDEAGSWTLYHRRVSATDEP